MHQINNISNIENEAILSFCSEISYKFLLTAIKILIVEKSVLHIQSQLNQLFISRIINTKEDCCLIDKIHTVHLIKNLCLIN